MGATNITAILKKEHPSNQFQLPIERRVYDIDVLDPAFTGITTVATHNIAPIAANECLLKLTMIVLTSFASTGTTGTIRWSMTEAISPVIAANGTELVKGDVLVFGETDLEDVAGISNFVSTATTLNLIVATNALTAGRFLLILDVLDVSKLYGNSL